LTGNRRAVFAHGYNTAEIL